MDESESICEGDKVLNGWGREVTMVKLGNGDLGFRHVVKCSHVGCARRKLGYLTEGEGGGAFYTKRGRYLADLRSQDYFCSRHSGSSAAGN